MAVFLKIMLAAAALVSLQLFVESTGANSSDALPKCDACDIGFDLTMDYGYTLSCWAQRTRKARVDLQSRTSAIRYGNGSIHDVVKVRGNQEYEDLMYKFADPDTTNVCITGPENFAQEVMCRAYWARRWLNKKRGLPATIDVGILSNLLQDLRSNTESTLSMSVDRAVISAPDLQGRLPLVDLEDAATHAGLTAQRTRHFGTVSESCAAFAALGYGLCEHTDPIECQDEENNMPGRIVLRLTMTDAAFTASCSYMRSAYIDWAEAETYRFDLGVRDLNAGNATLLLRDVQAAIVGVGHDCERMPDTLLLLGSGARYSGLDQAVRDALWELEPDVKHAATRMAMGKSDPTFLAARGSAEFMRRAQFDFSDAIMPGTSKAGRTGFEQEQILVPAELR